MKKKVKMMMMVLMMMMTRMAMTMNRYDSRSKQYRHVLARLLSMPPPPKLDIQGNLTPDEEAALRLLNFRKTKRHSDIPYGSSCRRVKEREEKSSRRRGKVL